MQTLSPLLLAIISPEVYRTIRALAPHWLWSASPTSTDVVASGIDFTAGQRRRCPDALVMRWSGIALGLSQTWYLEMR